MGWCVLLWDGIDKKGGGPENFGIPRGVSYLGGWAVVFVDGVVGEMEAERDA